MVLAKNLNNPKYRCQIILGGENAYPNNLILDRPKNEKDCLKAGKSLFKKNNRYYSKLYIFTDSKIMEVKIDD